MTIAPHSSSNFILQPDHHNPRGGPRRLHRNKSSFAVRGTPALLAALVALSACNDGGPQLSKGEDSDDESTELSEGSSVVSSSPSGDSLNSIPTGMSTGSTATSDSLSGETSSDSAGQMPVWGDCPERFSEVCRKMEVPLNWDLGEQKSTKLELLVARHKATKARKGQIWLLAGGPGGSGSDLFEIVKGLGQRTPEFDIFVLEHRGVGESGRLGCPNEEKKDSPMGFDIAPEEWASCISWLAKEWGPDLHAFNTTFAARDLHAAISAHAVPGESVFVYGQSYGTMLAMRHMMIAGSNSPVTGYVLDSVLSPKEVFIENFDAQIDPVARDLGALCAKNDGCRERMGDEPWEQLKKTFQRLGDGHCQALQLDRKSAGKLAAILVFNESYRKFLYPLAYRIERCSEADVMAVSMLFTHLRKLLESPLPSLPTFSPVLQNNILFAEVAHIPSEPLEKIQKRCDEELVLCPEISTKWIENWRNWPRYVPDQWSGRWPEVKVPLLAMNGELDPQTPHTHAAVIKKHLQGSTQNYVQFPYASHIVLTSTAVQSEGAVTCGMQVMANFVQNPTQKPDQSCLDDLVAENFDPGVDNIKALFGGEKLWDNGEEQALAPFVPTREDWQELLRAASNQRLRLR